MVRIHFTNDPMLQSMKLNVCIVFYMEHQNAIHMVQHGTLVSTVKVEAILLFLRRTHMVIATHNNITTCMLVSSIIVPVTLSGYAI